MTVDETLLMAYVDGELQPQQHAEVEALVDGSAEAAALVGVLRASRVDYRAAFAAQSLPPVPASLARGVDALIAKHRAGGTAANADAATEHTQSTTAATPAQLRAASRAMPVWLAAACVAGALCVGLLLRTGPLVGTGASAGGTLAQSSTNRIGAGNTGMSPWVTAAVGYQQLYTRDTVAYAQVDAKDLAATLDDIRAKDHLSLHVPDLSRMGLQLKAVQRLNFNNKPLVQIVYLPQKGPPVALCVLREPKPDAGVATRTVDAMHVVTWRQGELGYALIGKPDGIDLESIGRQIADGAAGALAGIMNAAARLSPDA
ncbi:anti-sigma factor family protein [Paraburkholderia flava]|uniref:anti-sigma factor family protein n=1 Tax=Paraburkholderia flava TaxID=2547393 RepID=UPI00105D9B70|nr:anti-sigma factor [Paraburkholderia flava]